MIIYITIVLFLIILFLDYEYKLREPMHGGGGASIGRGPNLSELNNDTLSQSQSPYQQVQQQEFQQEKENNKEIKDLMGSVYEPPTQPNIEGYTTYNNFSYSMSATPPGSQPNSTNTSQQRPPSYKKNFHDFGKFGRIPPDPVATTCFLDFACVNYPYSADERNANVCKRCIPNPITGQNYNTPQTYVMGREAGMPRQIRGVFPKYNKN